MRVLKWFVVVDGKGSMGMFDTQEEAGVLCDQLRKQKMWAYVISQTVKV